MEIVTSRLKVFDYLPHLKEGKVRFVGVGALDVIDSSDQEDYIGSGSFGSCAGLGIHDPNALIAGVIHLTKPTDINFLVGGMTALFNNAHEKVVVNLMCH